MQVIRHYNNISQSTERVPNSQGTRQTRTTRPARRGYGGFAPDQGGRVGRVQGTPAQTRTSCGSGGRASTPVGRSVVVRRPCVGAKVRRVGAGIWGFGTIIGIVPCWVNPRWYCRRHDLPVVFGVRSESANYVRYIVECDDGRFHTPNKVEVV